MKKRRDAKGLLAREILQEAIRLWRGENKDGVAVDPASGDFAIDVALADLGLGRINGNLLSTAQFFLQKSEDYIDRFPVPLRDAKDKPKGITLGAASKVQRDSYIRRMAVTATLAFIRNLESRFDDALYEGLEDSLVMAQIQLHDDVAGALRGAFDFGTEIKGYAKASAIRHESRLRDFVGLLENTKADGSRVGRPKEKNLTQRVADSFKEKLTRKAHKSEFFIGKFAADIRVSERTLRTWIKNQKHKDWKDVQRYYTEVSTTERQ
jgi:hypothetical protein